MLGDLGHVICKLHVIFNLFWLVGVCNLLNILIQYTTSCSVPMALVATRQ